MAKKRNPQDATLRNVRAAKKRMGLIDGAVAEFTKQVHALDWAVEEALARIDAISERVTRVEERLDYIADTVVLTDAMPPKGKGRK